MTEWWKAKKLEQVERSNVLRLFVGKTLEARPKPEATSVVEGGD